MRTLFLSCTATFCLLLPIAIVGFAPPIQQPLGTQLPQRLRCSGSPKPLSVGFVADAEKEEVYNNNDKKKSFEKSWIPTENGGFLPKLERGKRKKNAVLEVLSLEDYKRQVAQEKDRLVVVRFYAPWCRACKAIANSFHQLPKLYPNVKFVEVPLTKDTGVLHTGLGVPSLPYGHIYHPEAGLVEERRISRKHFQEFRDEVLQSYVDGFCNVQYDESGATNSNKLARE